MQEILKQVSDTVTDEPVIISVDVKPQSRIERLLQRFGLKQKKKSFPVTQVTLGNMIRISKLLLKIDKDIFKSEDLMQSVFNAISTNGETMAEITAIGLCNKKEYPGKEMIDLVLDNFTSGDMQNVLSIIVKQMNLTGFMISITSTAGLNILTTTNANATTAGENGVSH